MRSPNANLEDAIKELWREGNEFANGDNEFLLQNSLSDVERPTLLVQDGLELAGRNGLVQHLLFMSKHSNCDLQVFILKVDRGWYNLVRNPRRGEVDLSQQMLGMKVVVVVVVVAVVVVVVVGEVCVCVCVCVCMCECVCACNRV